MAENLVSKFTVNSQGTDIDVKIKDEDARNLIAQEISDRNSAINKEINDRENADTALQGKITAEITTITNNINQEVVQNTALVNSLETKLNNLSFINAINYGFVNDGTTDNSDIMDKFLSEHPNGSLSFPYGTYAFSRQINVMGSPIFALNGSTLKAISSMETLLSIRDGGTQADYVFPLFYNGILDGNYMVNNIFSSNKAKGVVLFHMWLKNTNKVGILQSNATSPDGNIVVAFCIVENTKDINETEVAGTVGIYANGFDSRYLCTTVINFQQGVYTIGNRFISLSCWIRSKNIVPGSQFAICDGYDDTFNDVYVDTYQYGFNLLNDNRMVEITNMLWILNPSVYTSEMQSQYPMIIFNCDYPGRKYVVTNVKISVYHNISFSKVTLWPYSTFVNVELVDISKNLNDVLGNYAYSLSCKTVLPSLAIYDTDTTGAFADATAKMLFGISPTNILIVHHDNDIFKAYRINENTNALEPLKSTKITAMKLYK